MSDDKVLGCDQKCEGCPERRETTFEGKKIEACPLKPAMVDGQPIEVDGIPLWEEDIFKYLVEINEATELRSLTRVEASALAMSWMVTGLAKNIDELALLGTEAEGPAKSNALLIADVCGSLAEAMKNDIASMRATSGRIVRVKRMVRQ